MRICRDTKRVLAVALSCLWVMSIGSTSYANDGNMPSLVTVTLNGAALVKAYSPNNLMSLFYVHDVLNGLGIFDSWDGRTRTWSIDSQYPLRAVQDKPSALHKQSDSTGDVTVTIDGRTVAVNLRSVTATDPNSNQKTTYLLRSNFSVILAQLGIKSSWDAGGRTWSLSTLSQPPTPLVDYSGTWGYRPYYPYQILTAENFLTFRYFDATSIVARDTGLHLFQVDVQVPGRQRDVYAIDYLYGKALEGMTTTRQSKWIEVIEYQLGDFPSSNQMVVAKYGTTWFTTVNAGNRFVLRVNGSLDKPSVETVLSDILARSSQPASGGS